MVKFDSAGPAGVEGCGCCGGGACLGGGDCSEGFDGLALGFLRSTNTIARITTAIMPIAPISTTIVSGSRSYGAVVAVGWFVGCCVGFVVGCAVIVGAGVGVAIVLKSGTVTFKIILALLSA